METKSAKAKGTPDIPLDEWYPTIPDGNRVPWKPISAVLGGVVVIAIVGIMMAELMPAPHPVSTPTASTTSAPTTTTAPPLGADAALDPCKGLSGELVTNKDGGQDSPLNLVAALEYAFYVKRDVSAVTTLYAPNVLASSAVASIQEFIAKIPQATKYCVAVRSTGPTTVDYDINEIRPTPGTQIYPAAATTYTESMTVTSSAPYLISSLHTRK